MGCTWNQLGSGRRWLLQLSRAPRKAPDGGACIGISICSLLKACCSGILGSLHN